MQVYALLVCMPDRKPSKLFLFAEHQFDRTVFVLMLVVH